MAETNEFKPAWWLRNSHLQTIWPALCRPNIKDINLKRERVELPDGDFIDLDWAPAQKNDQGPIVLILHGLEGSIDSHYAKSLLKRFTDHGWRGAFMHFRGCSGEPNRLARGYHSGETGDVEFMVRQLRDREPNVNIAVVGISLGGNVLLKWLGETQHNMIDAAIAVSVPFELHKAASRMQQGFSRFYQWYFMKCLRERLIEKFEVTVSPVNPEVLREVRTMFEFDDKITAPLHGFNDVNHYYSSSSSRQYLRNINVPTLILHAKDDPFMSADVIPGPHELSPKIILEVTEHGGHVGFVSGKFPWRPEYWLDQRIPDFLKDYFR